MLSADREPVQLLLSWPSPHRRLFLIWGTFGGVAALDILLAFAVLSSRVATLIAAPFAFPAIVITLVGLVLLPRYLPPAQTPSLFALSSRGLVVGRGFWITYVPWNLLRPARFQWSRDRLSLRYRIRAAAEYPQGQLDLSPAETAVLRRSRIEAAQLLSGASAPSHAVGGVPRQEERVGSLAWPALAQGAERSWREIQPAAWALRSRFVGYLLFFVVAVTAFEIGYIYQTLLVSVVLIGGYAEGYLVARCVLPARMTAKQALAVGTAGLLALPLVLLVPLAVDGFNAFALPGVLVTVTFAHFGVGWNVSTSTLASSQIIQRFGLYREEEGDRASRPSLQVTP